MRTFISHAHEIMFLQQRLAFILELERTLKQASAELMVAARPSQAAIQDRTIKPEIRA